jgi:hypothetical protein
VLLVGLVHQQHQQVRLGPAAAHAVMVTSEKQLGPQHTRRSSSAAPEQLQLAFTVIMQPELAKPACMQYRSTDIAVQSKNMKGRL